MTEQRSDYPPSGPQHSATLASVANLNSALYVEVENGERVYLPAGMTEADLLRSMLRQVLP